LLLPLHRRLVVNSGTITAVEIVIVHQRFAQTACRQPATTLDGLTKSCIVRGI
ncbi:unnamed protein product, partial [Ascophyllum nodosum]